MKIKIAAVLCITARQKLAAFIKESVLYRLANSLTNWGHKMNRRRKKKTNRKIISHYVKCVLII